MSVGFRNKNEPPNTVQHSIYFAFCKLKSALEAAGAGREEEKGDHQIIKPNKVTLIVCTFQGRREEAGGKSMCVPQLKFAVYHSSYAIAKLFPF